MCQLQARGPANPVYFTALLWAAAYL